MNKIRELEHIAVLWASDARHSHFMKDGGAKVAYSFEPALLDYDGGYAIPNGAPNKELAMQFLNEISKSQYRADREE